MNDIIIQAYLNRKLSKKTVDIGNMQENKVTKLIFELDEGITALGGNVYLFESYDGDTHPYPLKDNSIEIGRELTQRKKTEVNLVVSTSDDPQDILKDTVWISNTLMLFTDKNSINIDSINEQELPPSLKIVYDELFALQSDLQKKLDEDYWRGEDGKDGADGATFTPTVSEDGILSWTNDKGLQNPKSANIKGPAGKTAYQHAVDGGYKGTEEEFRESLVNLMEFEAYKANSILSKSTGEVVTTTDSAKAKPKNIRLYGKTEQDSTEGNQLFNAYAERNASRSTAEVTENGYNIKVTFQSAYAPVRFRLDASLFKANTTYLLIADENPVNCHIQFVARSEGVVMAESSLYNGSVLTSVAIGDIDFAQFSDAFDEQTHLGINLFINNANNAGEYNIKGLRLIEEGTNRTVWEPFTGNEPSPSMNYQQPLNSHGASGSIVGKVLNKNLFPVGEWGSEIQGNALIGNTMIRVIANTTYYCSFYAKLVREDIPTQSMRYRYYKEKASAYSEENTLLMGDIIAKITPTEQRFAFTFTPTQDCWLGLDYGDTFGGSKYRDIIVSQVDDTYEPYTEQPFTALTPNGLPGIPLGTTIPDAIANSPIHMAGVYWDNAEGKYYIGDTVEYESGEHVQRIGRKICTGNDVYSFTTSPQGYKYVFMRTIPQILDFTHSPLQSQYFRFIKFYDGDEGEKGIAFVNSAVRLYFGTDETVNSKEDVQELLQSRYDDGDGMCIDYILAEPITTDLTEEEMAQYNALVLNKGNNTLLNDAGAYMELEQVCDTQLHIEQNYIPKSEHEALKSRVSDIEQAIANL